MTLPGKLCIGILEEDNPFKSYFRFKPLLVEQEGCYVPFTDHQSYGDEGCIRIVPDKNESYHFKGRMRRMGLFCVVDLRAHPDENDKIRPNKNYREGGAEVNTCIIYSDVVREPAPDMIFEVLRAQPDAAVPEPHTPSVLLRGEDVYPERYGWEPVEDGEGQVRLSPTGETCPQDSVQLFDLPGFREETVSFAIVPAGRMESVTAAPVRPAREAEPKPAHEEPKPVHDEPKPVREEPKPEARESAPAAEDAGPKPEPHPAPQSDREAPESRLTTRQRMLAAQTGLNPRRGRSLQELVDEKWQRSRLSQLGITAADLETGMPVQSPVDSAVRAVRAAWDQPDLRDELLRGLGGIEEFGASLQECREAVRQRDIELRLDALEERRLTLLRELDQLARNGAETRHKLKEEIRRDEAASLADAVGRTEAARREQQKYEALAEEARAAAQDARRAVDELTGEELERRLRDFALNGRMVERLEQLRGEAEPVPEPVAAEALGPSALADRIAARFEAEGCPLDRLQALNLAACLGAGRCLILSGPVGSGKTETARLLAEALGWPVVAPGETVEGPAVVLLDDANAARPDRGPWAETACPAPNRRVIATVQDSHSGHPVSANALDRAFVVRLAPPADAPWQPRTRRAMLPEAPADLEAGFAPLPEALPAALIEGMDALRRALAGCGAAFSRRALEEAWRFCAALGDEVSPGDALDLAVSQRLLPGLLASAPLEVLAKLPGLLAELPRCRALLDQPLPILI